MCGQRSQGHSTALQSHIEASTSVLHTVHSALQQQSLYNLSGNAAREFNAGCCCTCAEMLGRLGQEDNMLV